MMPIRISLVLSVFCTLYTAVAQPEETKQYAETIKQRIHEFQYYLNQIADKKLDLTERNDYINVALELFIEKGVNSFMEVNSLYRPEPRPWPVRDYLGALRDLDYERVEIERSKVAYVGTFQKVATDRWEGYAIYYQTFKGCSGDWCYEETRPLKKRVKIVLQKVKFDDIEYYHIYLHDTQVLEWE